MIFVILDNNFVFALTFYASEDAKVPNVFLVFIFNTFSRSAHSATDLIVDLF